MRFHYVVSVVGTVVRGRALPPWRTDRDCDARDRGQARSFRPRQSRFVARRRSARLCRGDCDSCRRRWLRDALVSCRTERTDTSAGVDSCVIHLW